MRPVIGITMSLDRGGMIRSGINYSFIRREYGEQIRRAGGEPIFLDNAISPSAAAELCQGIIISGGEDIEPSLYGEENRHASPVEPAERTRWERQLIDACDKYERPILGICYGSQLLNLHYGGTLYQDIYAEQGTTLFHGKSTEPAVHTVTFEHDFLGYAQGQKVESNSRHHQAVRDVAPGFSVAARADDGIVEAIAGRGHFGIQWHPESDDTASQVYTEFVRLCAPRKRAVSQSDESVLEAL